MFREPGETVAERGAAGRRRRQARRSGRTAAAVEALARRRAHQVLDDLQIDFGGVRAERVVRERTFFEVLEILKAFPIITTKQALTMMVLQQNLLHFDTK